MQTEPNAKPDGPSAKPVGRVPELMRRRGAPSLFPRLPVWNDHRAWLSSCLLHTLVFVTIALLWQPRTRGTSDTADRPVGIAVMHASKNGEEYFLSGGPAAGGPQASSGAMAAQAMATDASGPPISVSDLMSELVGATGKGTNPAASDGGLGDGLSGLGTASSGTESGSGKTMASFMGLRGTGSSFVYVLDRSASMAEFDSAPMRFAKRELLKSIQSLGENNQFQIVFYNESPSSLNPGTSGGKLLKANETNTDRAARFVQAISPQGGTEHIPGLKLGLSYLPEVLFFLTDAAEPAMNDLQLLEIQNRADRSMTTIHAVQFNRGPAANDGGWIRQLAEMNRGTYRYVDILAIE